MTLGFETLSVIVGILGVAFVRTRIKTVRLSKLDWKVLLATLQPVPMGQITQIALEYLQPNGGHQRANREDLWQMVGESDGINRLYKNAEVLIALATYASQWNPHEARITVEQLRRDAVTLRRATLRLSVGMTLGFDAVRGPLFVQQAAGAYFTMQERVISLYSLANLGRLNDLKSYL